MYDAIILCGSKSEMSGRNIAGYRLRTAARKLGYKILVIDSASAMNTEELEETLNAVITQKTLALGISTVWLDGSGENSEIAWINKGVIKRLREKFPKLKIVAGGVGLLKMRGSMSLYLASDWHVTGFSDDSFPRLLKLLDGKSDHQLKYFLDSNGKKTIESNKYHQIHHPDDIETEFEESDGFLRHQPLPLEVSRGCIFRCAFCNHPFQGAKDYDSYIRTPESIARELRRNYELFGTTRYSLMDDTFNDSIEKLDRLKRAIEIAKLPDFEFQCYTKPELLVTKPEMIDQLIGLGIVGGFAGIESFNTHARKSMNKGMNVQKVFDALEKLNSKSSKVKLHSSIILGLPGDKPEEFYQWQEYFIKHQNSLFKSWEYIPLGIYTPSKADDESGYLSPLEKDPESYGYTFSERKEGYYSIWSNGFVDSIKATEIAAELNNRAREVAKPGGWHVSTAWHVGVDTKDMDQTISKLNLGPRCRAQARQRAIDTHKKLTKK